MGRIAFWSVRVGISTITKVGADRRDHSLARATIRFGGCFSWNPRLDPRPRESTRDTFSQSPS